MVMHKVKAVVKEFEICINKNKTEKVIGIGFIEKSGAIFPSPLGNFIKSEYRNKGQSINSQRNAAYAITRFINFLLKNLSNGMYLELRNEGLKSLTLHHAADYITNLSFKSRTGELNSNYVESQIYYINKFFHWLHRQEILKEKYLITQEERRIHLENRNNEIKKIILGNLFEINDIDVVYPSKNIIHGGKINTFGEERDRLIGDFLTVARKVEPSIALGVGLQMFAGLRRGEVVNLKPSSFRWENNSLVIEVRDNQQELFPNLSNSADIQVKNPRNQICLCSDILKFLFNEHMEILSKIKDKKTEGLFISNRTKSTIRGNQFSIRFEKIKDVFLEEVLLSGNQKDYLLLTSNNWSTHIGRGIFTNILLDLGLSATQIALARGDKNINSSQSYVDSHTMIISVNTAINNFRILL